jgi:hypothetical protein
MDHILCVERYDGWGTGHWLRRRGEALCFTANNFWLDGEISRGSWSLRHKKC